MRGLKNMKNRKSNQKLNRRLDGNSSRSFKERIGETKRNPALKANVGLNDLAGQSANTFIFGSWQKKVNWQSSRVSGLVAAVLLFVMLALAIISTVPSAK